ncbi:uncharacterized protein LOC135146802 [Daucus carota subsp. sativus]|uniref:uncharacterized protein LOC135146802 n=1 Tax=Daucus carota subsp. sativus TaxID=79200 RepID=UPI00308378F3
MQEDALYSAAIAGDTDAIAALEMHADKLNIFEKTILHTQSQDRNTEHVRIILREFADKNLLVKLNEDKKTALHFASSQGHTELAEILINAARHLLPTDHDDAVTSFQAFLRQADNKMQTALHEAVKKGNVALFKLLVEADPSDTHTRNNGGETPIYIAAESGYCDIVKMICTTRTAPLDLDGPGGSTTVLHILINNADPEKEEDGEMIRQITEAVINNHRDEEFKNLIQFFDRTDEKRSIILELAVEKNYLDTVQLILAELDAQLDEETNNSRKFIFAEWEPTKRMCSNLMSIKPLIYKVMDKEYTDMFNLLTLTYQRYDRKAEQICVTRSLYAPATADIFKMPRLIHAISSRQQESVISMLKEYYADTIVTFADNLGWTAIMQHIMNLI